MRHPLLGAVLACLLSTQPQAASPVRIDISPMATTERAVYRLGDIATVHAADDATRRRLENTVIGHSPRVGQLGYVSRIDLEARLRSVLGGSDTAIQWTGAPIAKIRTQGREIPRARLVTAAETALRQWLEDKVGQASIHLLGDVEQVLVPDGEVAVRASISDSARLAQKMSVWVDVSVADEHYQSIPVWFDVDAMRQVYSVTNDLPPGHVLMLDDLSLSEVDIAAVKGHAWKVGTPLEDLRTRKWVARSSVLTEELLEAVPDIVKGQKVTVTATSGPVALQVAAVALKDGNVNDVIPVTRQQRQDRFQVVVTGKGQAVVADATSDEK